MVEQPFPVEFSPGADMAVDLRWRRFREALNAAGVFVYADESISTASDVERFAPFVDGVNIKLEKAGGMRGAIVAMCRARALGLRVWIGTMVSSCLGCAQAAQLAYLADDADVDGGLLVFPDVFEGGFRWGDQGSILLEGYGEPSGVHNPAAYGFGVTEVCAA
jgi:L-alanine-DL-glutamate epimerase-like enolase superfamily enzyme